ncbi:Alpha/Beta hydrolase protein [Boletus reticuloceps]|uniref:Alpha/Beta hydrolase protein n=1 Tax=Boletus reticuloceps TaxID=495285 RepID=A0A8I3A7N3_9AGAM|nr:Alpha/Beta hydrolase protein [Boletus reticuloceps]
MECEPILFIHGLGGTGANIGPVIEASRLASTRKIITFDLEGHGLSPLSGNEISLVNYAESARAVLDVHGVDKAVVIGHSMGGFIAATLAAAYPAKVAKLILLGTVKQFGELGVKALTARADAVRKDGMIAIADAVSKAGMSQRSLETSLLARHFARVTLLNSPVGGYVAACLAVAKATDPEYANIMADTLILAGEEDKVSLAEVVVYLKEHIPKTKVITMKNVGHWHLVEDIEGVAQAIKEFIE